MGSVVSEREGGGDQGGTDFPSGFLDYTVVIAMRYLYIWYINIPCISHICHRGYTVLQTVQRHGVYSAAYGTVHYKEPLKSFEIRVGQCPSSRLPSVAILP